MSEEVFQAIAAQLRQPRGEGARPVAEKMNQGNRILNERSIAALDIQPGDRILEIGMGNGLFVQNILQTPGVSYTGCDFSTDMVQQASELNHAFMEEGRASFVLGEAGSLPFAEDSFDAILTVNTIYFWKDPDEVMRDLARVLKPGGKLLIAGRPASTMKHYPFVKYGFTLYSPENVSSLMQRHRFKVELLKEEREPDQEINGGSVKVDGMLILGRLA